MEEYQQKFIPIVLAVVAVVAFVSVVATTGPYLVRALIEHVRENWLRRRRQDPEPEMDVDESIDYISQRQGEPARQEVSIYVGEIKETNTFVWENPKYTKK